MKASKAKSIAARLLKTGESKVWVDPQNIQKVSEAITKEDVRSLIAQGFIKKSKDNQKSSGQRVGKRRRRKTGPGKKRGKAGARIKPKQRWIAQVRAQRKKLKELKKNKVKFKTPYRQVYKMVKGGFFKGKKYLEIFVTGAKK